jgi:adenine-specific DNA-methyltransferase
MLSSAGQLSYMGTKSRIAPDVARVILGHGPEVVIDPFAGMGAVASALEDEAQLILSDSLRFVANLARARFTGAATPRLHASSLRCDYRRHRQRLADSVGQCSTDSITDRIKTTRRVSNDPELRARALQLRASRSSNRYRLATLYYADTYFSLEQCIEIDSIRYAIDRRPRDEHGALLTCFLIACSRCVNAPGHTAQYLRASNQISEQRVKAKWARSIWETFTAAMDAFEQRGSADWRRGNRVRCGDAPKILRALPQSHSGLVYMDPPYTKDHYSRFYHVYEELFLYRFPAVSGEGIYPDDRFVSRFSIKSVAAEAYRELFAEAARVAPWMVLSFPEQTFLGKTEEVLLPLLFGTHSVTSIHRVAHVHSTLGGSTGAASVPVIELLIDCEAN